MKSKSAKLLIFGLASLLFLLTALGSNEQNAPVKSAQPSRAFLLDVWKTDKRLPQSSVTAIIQTSDGYIWIGTFGGLTRFDGINFTVFDAGNTAGLKSNRILALYEDREKNLWIGTERGGLTKYAAGKFVNYAMKDGLPSDNVASIDEDRDGNIWIGTERGLTKFAGTAFETFTKKDGLPDDPVSRIAEAADGALWFGTNAGVVRMKNGQFTTFTPEDGLAEYFVQDIKFTADGNLWVATNREIARFENNRFVSYKITDDPLGTIIRCLYEDRDGFLWVATDHGLIRVKDGKISDYTTNNPLSDKNIMAIAGDREGNLWIGTVSGGLNRLKSANLIVYGAKQGLTSENLVPVTEDAAGDIWTGATCGGLIKFSAGEFTTYTKRDGLPNDCVWSLLADDDGSLWLGTWNGGLTHFSGGRFTTFDVSNSGISNNVVLALHKTGGGALWIGTGAGLNRFKDGEFTVYRTSDGLVSDDVRFVTEDRAGALWIGTTGGLSRFKDGSFTNLTTADGLAHNFVRDVYEDGDGAVWIGTYGGGLHRLKDGLIKHIGAKDGLFDDVVSRILEDADGNLWMSGNRGIFRVSGRELNDFAAGRVNFVSSVSYDETDGMTSRETNGGGQPAGWKARDGKMWFPTIKGAVVVDPQTVKINETPPPVVVETALANKKNVGNPAKIELSPDNTDLEVRYAGLSFVAPEKVRFKYRLEGYDKDWTEAGTRRTAFYTNIPPGNFRFRVIAANNDGVWNTDGATLEIVVVPPFYRTWWFYALAALAIGFAVYSLYKYRIARLERARAAQEAFSHQLIASQETERRRIAAELHDSLGQNLLIIKNRALIGTSKIANSDAALRQFDEISSTASHAIEEVRAIAHNLHPYQLERLGLTAALESVVEKIADASAIRFSWEIDPVDRLFSPADEINIYRIAQESLNNVVRHSDATEARVSVKRDGQNLYLRIEDNGRGFVPHAASGESKTTSGLGLQGIVERARMLGGSASIESAPDAGTKIFISLAPKNQKSENKNFS